MSWIKENKFLAGLGGGTLLGAILLFVVGLQGGSKYSSTKEQFDTTYNEASEFEKLALYPTDENQAGKTKALDEYKKAAESIQAAFEPFRPKEIKDISSQAFADNLLAANAEVRKAFEDTQAIVPEPFFLGFERYRTSLASGSTTGLLSFQMDAVKKLMLSLAKSGVSELKNVHRPSLPEEDGQTFTPAETAVSRALPIEITFTGSEKSAREFISSIVDSSNGYFVIRALRISNEKKEAGTIKDIKFEAGALDGASAGGGDGGFVLPPAGGEEAAPAAPTATPADSSQILSQVLGSEKLNVFLRIDLLQFLPAKKLP